MKTELSLLRPRLEPSSIAQVEADASLEAVAKELSIGQIPTEFVLQSSLMNGKLEIGFSPHFAWGISKAKIDSKAAIDLEQQLLQAGLAKEDVKKALKVLDNYPSDVKVGDVVYDANASSATVGEDSVVLTPTPDGKRATFNLPSFPTNVKTHIDISDLSFKNLRLATQTRIVGKDLKTTGTTIGDFRVITDTPDMLGYKQLEVTEAVIQPVDVPSLSIPGVETTLEIPQVGIDEWPIEFKTDKGSAKINLKLLDWHPRWRTGICIKIWHYQKCAWIEFGLNATLVLKYDWILTSLTVTAKIKKMFLKGIQVTGRLTGITAEKIRIGLLRVGSLLAKPAKKLAKKNSTMA